MRGWGGAVASDQVRAELMELSVLVSITTVDKDEVKSAERPAGGRVPLTFFFFFYQPENSLGSHCTEPPPGGVSSPSPPHLTGGNEEAASCRAVITHTHTLWLLICVCVVVKHQGLKTEGRLCVSTF